MGYISGLQVCMVCILKNSCTWSRSPRYALVHYFITKSESIPTRRVKETISQVSQYFWTWSRSQGCGGHHKVWEVNDQIFLNPINKSKAAARVVFSGVNSGGN